VAGGFSNPPAFPVNLKINRALGKNQPAGRIFMSGSLLRQTGMSVLPLRWIPACAGMTFIGISCPKAVSKAKIRIKARKNPYHYGKGFWEYPT